MYQFLAIPNKMNITLFLSSLFFVLDEFPDWKCKEAIDFVLDKQYTVSALCPLQCDTKIQKLSASAVKKISKMISSIEINNEDNTDKILYILITIISIQTMCMLACGVATYRIFQKTKLAAKIERENKMTEMKEENLRKIEMTEMKDEESIKQETV